MNQQKNKKRKKRTPFWAFIFHVRNVGILLGLLSTIILFIITSNTLMESVPFDKNPFTHFNGIDPSSQMYITWETEKPQGTVLWLGTSPDHLVLNYSDPAEATFHRIKLENLTADTIYYYRVGSQVTPPVYHGPLSQFRTAPLDVKPFKFVLFSDSQQLWGIGHYGSIANQINKEKDLSFVSCVGDLVEDPNIQSEWNLFLKESEGWEKTASFVPVIGNHDIEYGMNEATGEVNYSIVNQSLYKKYYGFSYDEGPYKGHFFYSFNWSNVQFVIGEISDTNTREGAFAVYHDAWLNDTLAKGQDKTFRILMFHRNLMTSTTSDGPLIERISAIAEAYNVSIVIFGHNHHYERLLYHGISYLCLGGGGGMQDGAFRIIPESQFLNIGPSYTQVSINVDQIVFNTYSEQQDLIESFTLISNGSRAILKTEVI
ncbi:MAG: metallophosphoesterase [Promethearchaeota archaeon]